jgi:hypothetical protein
VSVTFRLTPAQIAAIQPPVYLDREGVIAGQTPRAAAPLTSDQRPAATLTAAPAPASGTVLTGQRPPSTLLGG